MRQNATKSLALALMLAVIGVFAPATSVIAQELGDDFIFFVNGTNVQVPSFDGAVADDPFDAANKALKIEYGDWSEPGFHFSRSVGIDMSANVAAGDTLSFRILSDTANAAQAGSIHIMLLDKTDDSGEMDGSADLAFRLRLNLPASFHDGTWHDLVIPLPGATWQDQEDAKAAGLDGLDSLWAYQGAWSNSANGIGQDGLGPNTTGFPELWKEFEWANVGQIGLHFDHANGGGAIYLDDVFIGDGSLDLSVALDPPAAMSGVTFAADGVANLVSWTSSTEIGGYNIYVSESAITDVSADGVALFGAATADVTEIRHQFEVPHPSLLPLEFHYAVASLSNFGVVNPDVSASTGSVANSDLVISPRITQLTEAEGDELFDALGAGTAIPVGLAAFDPFVMDAAHSTLTELAPPSDDADNSVKAWLGYTDLNELYIYAEVRDDSTEYAGAAIAAGDAWQYDSIEFGWGNYDISDVSGSLLDGSPHVNMERGDFADYQFRVSGPFQAYCSVVGQTTVTGGSGENPAGSGAVFEPLMDGGNIVGWKFLAVMPLDAIQNPDEGDVVYPLPGPSEMRLMPFTISSNDADGLTRETQITWSLRGNVTSQWYNTPNQWPVVAMIGRDLATSIDGTDDVPSGFAVHQNYPNPFNQTTTIRFALDGASDVTLRVYDILGRVVATPIAGQTMGDGEHVVTFDARTLASGQYLYRLEAGSASQSRRMLLVK